MWCPGRPLQAGEQRALAVEWAPGSRPASTQQVSRAQATAAAATVAWATGVACFPVAGVKQPAPAVAGVVAAPLVEAEEEARGAGLPAAEGYAGGC
jgi:hypothetical protein